MAITYYPVVTKKYYPLPIGLTSYPGPSPNAISLPIKLLDIVLCAKLDMFTTYERDREVDWLEGMIKSAVELSPSGEICLKFGANILSGWKGISSETIGTSVSLAIATSLENYMYFVPVSLCKKSQKKKYAGNIKWPLFIAQDVPHTWFVDKLAPFYKKILMPDYILMDWDKDVPRFSVLESKGKDTPVNSATSIKDYENNKHQSQNARLISRDKKSTVIPPDFYRKILSVVAVRQQEPVQADRKIECRWFNDRERENIEIPPLWAIDLAADHYQIFLRQLGFRRISGAIARARKFGIRSSNNFQLRIFPSIPDIFILGNPSQKIQPFITLQALKSVNMLIDFFCGDKDSGDALLAQLKEKNYAYEVSLDSIEPSNFSILPSGIGLLKL